MQSSTSADAIINLLQQKPSLLRAAKIRMAQVLGVDPGTLTDQMLFDRIRQDANLRQKITQELQKHGFYTTSLIESQYGNQAQYGNQGLIGNPLRPVQQMPLGNQLQPDYQTQLSGQNGNQPNGCPSLVSSQGILVSQSAATLQTTYSPQLATGVQPVTNAQSATGCLPVTTPQAEALQPQIESQQPQFQQKIVPYSNLPSLQDLYTQMLSPDADLKRFGSDVFVLGTGNTDTLPMDLPAGPDYMLGPGDALTINIWGSQTLTLNQVIDRQGQVALTDSGTVAVGGMTIAQGQEAIRKVLKTQYRDVHVEISLGRIHTVRVYVVGDVQRPGAYDISSLSTPMNALYAAGGPTSRGSLRVLKQYRGDKLVQVIDLYDYLLRGIHSDLERLLPGDTILVPTVGPQVAVTGMVRRPAIYELRGGESLKEALDLAGGVLASASLRQVNIERIEAHQRRTMLSVRLSMNSDITDANVSSPVVDLPTATAPRVNSRSKKVEKHGTDSGGTTTDPKSADAVKVREVMQKLAGVFAQDGDKIIVLPILPYNEQAVFLDGHVFRPGKYPYREGMTINDILRSYQDVMPEPRRSR